MNSLFKKVLIHAASLYQKASNSKSILAIETGIINTPVEGANLLILNRIKSGLPFMAARFGSGELEIVAIQHTIHSSNNVISKSIDYIFGRTPAFWWNVKSLKILCYINGIFPVNKKIISGFYHEMINSIQKIDVLASWLKAEQLFETDLLQAIKIELSDLEPYYHNKPWSIALKGKKVLIVHPFEDTIKMQYQKRELLFDNPDVLPEFDLITIKAVQSIANNNGGYKDWFEALNSMKEKISAVDFDIAIIGCGAYGMPLAAYVKSLGKQAIHMGGATQILFGIKGKRWDVSPFFNTLYNEHWVRPSEIPLNFDKVEGGSYW